MEKADKLFEGKVIFVVDGKQIIKDETGKGIEFKNADVSNIISMLAGEGRFSLYFDTDKEENLKIIKELVENIFGKGAEATKTMISLGTTYTANMFAELFKKDAPTKCFSNAYDGNVSQEIVAGAFKEILTGEKNYNEFVEYKKAEGFKYKDAITNEFEKIVLSSIDNDKTIKSEEKTAMLRQYVMGFMISYIEKHFDKFYEIPDRDWNKIIDIKQMDINVKNQIIYRIIYLLLSGNSPETIKENLSIVDKNQQKEGSMEEIVKRTKNGIMSKNISNMLIKTDSVMDAELISEENSIALAMYNDINILLEDSSKKSIVYKNEKTNSNEQSRKIRSDNNSKEYTKESIVYKNEVKNKKMARITILVIFLLPFVVCRLSLPLPLPLSLSSFRGNLLPWQSIAK